MTDFKPYVGRKRRSGTGCVSEINDHLFEGRYSPKWPDGKKHARNIYAHTRGIGIASSRVRRSNRQSRQRLDRHGTIVVGSCETFHHYNVQGVK